MDPGGSGIKLKNKNERLAGFNMQTNLLFDKGIVPEFLYIGFKKVLHEIMDCVSLMDEAIKFLKYYVKENLK